MNKKTVATTKEEIIKALLEEPFWLETLKPDEPYSRLHDDHDGTFTGRICVVFSNDGDAWISIDKVYTPLRFRTLGGGGNSLRVRNALMILAEAIRLDNLEKPECQEC